MYSCNYLFLKGYNIYLQYRANEVVPQRMAAMKEAILKKDFQKFGQLTMQVSSQPNCLNHNHCNEL